MQSALHITSDEFNSAAKIAERAVFEMPARITYKWRLWFPCSYSDAGSGSDTAPVYTAVSLRLRRGLMIHFTKSGDRLEAWVKQWASEPKVDYLNIMSAMTPADQLAMRCLLSYWLSTKDPLQAAASRISSMLNSDSKGKNA